MRNGFCFAITKISISLFGATPIEMVFVRPSLFAAPMWLGPGIEPKEGYTSPQLSRFP